VSGTTATSPILEIKGLSARYGHVQALRPVDLYVQEGELVAVLGPNGAGKSTLMRAVMGLVSTEGRVTFGGNEVPRRNPAAAAAVGLVLVPEGRGIFAPMTVAENLELGAYLLKGNKSELARRYERVLSLFPRLKERHTQVAGSLSGGEQQMLAIGRALMSQPKMLLLDEPSLGLAPRVVARTLALLRRLRDEAGLTVLLVEQNVRSALSVADDGVVMALGRVVASAPAGQLAGDDQLRHAYLGF
jgi:branched-chain amino acid transport system ATP-binding protein